MQHQLDPSQFENEPYELGPIISTYSIADFKEILV